MKVAYSVVFLVLALTLSIFGTDTYAAIPVEGFPRFTNTVRLGVTGFGDDGVTITAVNDGVGDFFFTLRESGQRYDVKNGLFRLTANFDEDFGFHSGSVAIDGTFWAEGLPNPPVDTRINLFSANLGEADFSQLFGSNPSVGFRTLYDTFDGWAAQFATTDESIHLTGFSEDPNNLLPFLLHLANGTVTATAVTTVPVPTALWLLVSGLPALAAVRRKTISAA